MSKPSDNFAEAIRVASRPLILFESIPPVAGTDEGALKAWQDRLLTGLSELPVDGINLPEVRDETREGQRTYHYSRKMEPRVCGRRLQEVFPRPLPTVINRVVVHEVVEKQKQWLQESHDQWGVRQLILVGGESPTIRYPGPSVDRAARLITQELNPGYEEPERFICGGIVIPGRTKALTGFDERDRMIYKQKHGIEFFSTQVLYEPGSICRLIDDYEAACVTEHLRPGRIFLSLAPLRLAKHLEFVQWLGVGIPDAVRQELLHGSGEMGERSIQVCTRIVENVLLHVHAKKSKVPLGFNLGPLMSSNFSLSLELVKRVNALL